MPIQNVSSRNAHTVPVGAILLDGNGKAALEQAVVLSEDYRIAPTRTASVETAGYASAP